MQLIGKLYRSKGGWTADWIFVDDGRVLSKWSDSKSDARRALASGADGAADALTRGYAKLSPSGPPGTYRVHLPGLHSCPAHAQTSADRNHVGEGKEWHVRVVHGGG